jgi:hypothetical protein
MIASIFIFAISLGLLAYWLRYSCLFLLRDAKERSTRSEVRDNRFHLPSVMERLKSGADLAELERELERDYVVVSYLIKHAADLELASIENRILVLDYKLMRIWSRLTRTLAPEKSRSALAEMASVLGVLVNQMGESGSGQEA